MSFRVELATPADGDALAQLHATMPRAWLYRSPAYLRLLRTVLGEGERTLIARDGQGDVRGYLPAFVSPGSDHAGPVLNSLPFFGSHGGVVARPDDPAVASTLLGALGEVCEQERIAAMTLIEVPDDPFASDYVTALSPTDADWRQSHMTPLTGGWDHVEGRFHSKTRYAIRRAAASTHSAMAGPEGLELLARLHVAQCDALGRAAKPPSFFTAVREGLRQGDDYEVFVARLDGAPVAAVLVFFIGPVAEYYLPAMTDAAKPVQAVSGLIAAGMEEATRRGLVAWNFGGTWPSQASLRRFKTRFGAVEGTYRYHVVIRDEAIRAVAPQTLLDAYPHFYVRPFNVDGAGA